MLDHWNMNQNIFTLKKKQSTRYVNYTFYTEEGYTRR